jgi:hypothetical protein
MGVMTAGWRSGSLLVARARMADADANKAAIQLDYCDGLHQRMNSYRDPGRFGPSGRTGAGRDDAKPPNPRQSRQK